MLETFDNSFIGRLAERNLIDRICYHKHVIDPNTNQQERHQIVYASDLPT